MSRMSDSLREAVFSALNSNAELELLIGAGQIFDHHAKNANYPYILVVNWRANDWSCDDFEGEEHQFELEIFDDQPSLVNLHNIARTVTLALHDQSLTLTTGSLINLRLENSFFQTQRRTNIQLSRLKFRAKTEI